jgi:hypothetical protein
MSVAVTATVVTDLVRVVRLEQTVTFQSLFVEVRPGQYVPFQSLLFQAVVTDYCAKYRC